MGGWPGSRESFKRGNSQDQAKNSVQDQSVIKSYAFDKTGKLRPYAIKIYEKVFALATDYDLYINHGLTITLDDVIFAHGGIRGYSETAPVSDQDTIGPDGISREWMEFPSLGTNNFAPVSISVSSKYLHVRRVTGGTPSIISTARITLAYFTEP